MKGMHSRDVPYIAFTIQNYQKTMCVCTYETYVHIIRSYENAFDFVVRVTTITTTINKANN